MLLAELHPFNPIGKVLGPFIFFLSSGVALLVLLVCLIFAVIAYRRTRHSGFLWLLIGLGLSVFNQLLYSGPGLAMWRLLDGTFIYTLLKLYNVFVSPSVLFVCLAVALWRLGIGRHAVPRTQPAKTPSEPSA